MVLRNPHFILFAVVLAAAAAPALAGAGHDHGDEAPPAPSGAALPRFAAVSETFELVGVVDGRRVTLYLDRFADNSPVEGAALELEIGDAKLAAREEERGEYVLMLPEAPRSGVLPVTATVLAGDEADLLAGDLDIHEDAREEAAGEKGSRTLAAGAAGGLALLAVAGWASRRFRGKRAGGEA